MKSRPPRHGKGRVSRPEVDARVDRVLSLLVSGASPEEVRHFLASNYDISPRQAAEYLGKAREVLRERAEPMRDEALGTALERYRSLYKTATLSGDLRAAIAAQTRIDKLLGLEAPLQTEISGRGGGPVPIERMLDDAELSRRLRAQLEPSPEGRAFTPAYPTATKGH